MRTRFTKEEALQGSQQGGLVGGPRVLELYGKEHFRELGRKSAAGRARKLSREDVRLAKLRYEDGETLQEVASSFGVSIRTLRRELAS